MELFDRIIGANIAELNYDQAFNALMSFMSAQ